MDGEHQLPLHNRSIYRDIGDVANLYNLRYVCCMVRQARWTVDLENMAIQSERRSCAKVASGPRPFSNGERTNH
jgi:hypothetical protein